jgi:hypothetical protein
MEMSKGPGNQQRRILDALEKYPAFYLSDLYRRRPFFHIEGRVDDFNYRSEQVALIRAAHQLRLARKVEIRNARTRPILVIARPGFYSHADVIINSCANIRRCRMEVMEVAMSVSGWRFRHLAPNHALSVE